MSAESLSLEMAAIVLRAAEPARAGERTAEQLRRAARRLGLTYAQTRRLHYREWPERSIPAWIADRLRAFDARAARLNEELDQLQLRLEALRDGG